MTRHGIEALLQGAYFPDNETREAVIARVSEAIPQATERKTAKPIEAWAVVDKDNEFSVDDIFDSWHSAQAVLDSMSLHGLDQDRAPHRVARVVISEVEPAP